LENEIKDKTRKEIKYIDTVIKNNMRINLLN